MIRIEGLSHDDANFNSTLGGKRICGIPTILFNVDRVFEAMKFDRLKWTVDKARESQECLGSSSLIGQGGMKRLSFPEKVKYLSKTTEFISDKKINFWIVINGKKLIIKAFDVDELVHKVKELYGDDWFIIQEGKMVQWKDIQVEKVIRICPRLRGGSGGPAVNCSFFVVNPKSKIVQAFNSKDGLYLMEHRWDHSVWYNEKELIKIISKNCYYLEKWQQRKEEITKLMNYLKVDGHAETSEEVRGLIYGIFKRTWSVLTFVYGDSWKLIKEVCRIWKRVVDDYLDNGPVSFLENHFDLQEELEYVDKLTEYVKREPVTIPFTMSISVINPPKVIKEEDVKRDKVLMLSRSLSTRKHKFGIKEAKGLVVLSNFDWAAIAKVSPDREVEDYYYMCTRILNVAEKYAERKVVLIGEQYKEVMKARFGNIDGWKNIIRIISSLSREQRWYLRTTGVCLNFFNGQDWLKKAGWEHLIRLVEELTKYIDQDFIDKSL
jgi:hypothetical protein